MDQISLVIILLAALLIPLIMARFKLTLLPTAVIEIIVGVILGPSVFDLITANTTLDLLKNVGVIVLLFLSGLEIDFSLFRKRNTELTPLEQKQALDAPKYSSVALASSVTVPSSFYRLASAGSCKSPASSATCGYQRSSS